MTCFSPHVAFRLCVTNKSFYTVATKIALLDTIPCQTNLLETACKNTLYSTLSGAVSQAFKGATALLDTLRLRGSEGAVFKGALKEGLLRLRY